LGIFVDKKTSKKGLGSNVLGKILSPLKLSDKSKVPDIPPGVTGDHYYYLNTDQPDYLDPVEIALPPLKSKPGTVGPLFAQYEQMF